MSIFKFTNMDYHFLDKKIFDADLILVDLDGVVFTPKQYLCSSYWYVNYIETNKKEFNDINSSSMVNTLYECMSKTSFIPVDKNMIDNLTYHATTKDIIGLTSRTINFKFNTEISLNSVGMKFTNIDLEMEFNNQSIFNNGIIYAGHDPETGLSWNKALALDVFLKNYSKDVYSVLFIDDFEKNLINVANYCHSKNIEFTGIHYSKVVDSYENQGMNKSILSIIGKAQFHQLFNNEESYISSDQETYDIIFG